MSIRHLIRTIFWAAVGLSVICLLLVGVAYFCFGRGGEAEEIRWGVSFDSYYAEYLGLDWQEAYLALLDEVGVDHLRLVAFWDAVEPEDDRFDFARLDFQIREAERRGAKVILAIGRRLPRWPECHIPTWARGLSEEEQQIKVLEFLPDIVNRYKDSPALEFWQVENEPFVSIFGECPQADESFIREEMALVETYDGTHPILLTESGELSTWFKISRLSDHVGISVYEVIYDDGESLIPVPGYRRYPFPQEYYRIRANFFKWLGWIEEIFVSELQAEPWGPEPVVNMPLEEQYRSFNPDGFRHNLSFARSTGFSRFYLWGAEWWLYAREEFGVTEFIEIAKALWQ